MSATLQLDPRDNARVALRDLAPGEEGCSEPIAAKHKFATEALAVGDPVTLYGVLVGKATQPVSRGALLHTHNLSHAAEAFGIEGYAEPAPWPAPDVSAWQDRTFLGYRRSDTDRLGTGNYWVVLPLVFCENRNLGAIETAFARAMGRDTFSPYEDYVRQLAEAHEAGEDLGSVDLDLQRPATSRLFPGVDGLKFLAHEGGCGCDRGDSDALVRLLAGYVTHPNVAGATILSLGCQHATIGLLEEEIHRRCPGFDRPLLVMEEQGYSSEADFLGTAIRETFLGLAKADGLVREELPLSGLSLGVECGGSDGFSGISANPAMGLVSDRLAALGGQVMLAEFPELCGVENELIGRCADRATAERFVDLMRRYEAHAHGAGSDLSMNPSPGNIADGLITDAIKSAGAAKKGGASPVTGVLDYTEPATRAGLNLLCTPGNDVESTTALAGSGANLILFSTGLGTPTGNPICPVLKVSSNHATAERHREFIDYDAGGVIDGGRSLEQAADDLLELCIATASGQPSKAMRRAQDDFIPWRRGVSL